MTDRPSWQQRACPDWCTGGHREGDSPSDRVHRSRGIAEFFTGRRARIADGRLRVEDGPEKLVAGLALVDGEERVWFYLGTREGPQFEVDLVEVGRLRTFIYRAVMAEAATAGV